MEPPDWIPLGRRVQRPLEPPEVRGGCQAHANPPPLGSSERTPNQGPFPPLALPSFLGTMGPSDACRAHPPKGLVPGRPGRSTGLPGSYQGVPTPPWTGLSPAALTGLSRRTLNVLGTFRRA